MKSVTDEKLLAKLWSDRVQIPGIWRFGRVEFNSRVEMQKLGIMSNSNQVKRVENAGLPD